MGTYYVKIDCMYSSEPFDPSDRPPTYYIKGSCGSITTERVLKELIPYIEFAWEHSIDNLDEFADSRGQLSSEEVYSSNPEDKQYSFTIMLDAGAYSYAGDGCVWLNNYHLSKYEIDNGLRNIISAIKDGTEWIESEDDLDSTSTHRISGDQSDLTDY